MPSYEPRSRVELFRPSSFGAASVRKLADLDTLLRADMSLPVQDGVGQANLVFADPKAYWLNKLALQPMDIVRVWGNSRLKKTPVVAWTGFITDAYPHFENQQYGQTLVIQATTPYLLWENTTFLLSDSTNDAATLALAYIAGIGGRDLIKFTASRVKYPGPLGALTDPYTGQPNPAGLQLYGVDPLTGRYTQPEFVGQRNYSLPDDLWSNPDLQNYGTVLQALVADTGMVLYSDEFGSLCFKPLPYLTTPSNPRILDPIEIVDSVLDTSEQGIITEVRVAWQNTYVYSDYAVSPQANTPTASAVTTLEAAIGRRVLTLNQSWINYGPSAQFLADQLVRQYAAGVAKGQVTILADPGCRPGGVVGVPTPTTGNAIQYYGISNVIDSWVYGGPWLRTLQLVYGRDLQQSFPLVGVLQAPAYSASILQGVPGQQANGQIINPLTSLLTSGKQQPIFVVDSNTSVGAGNVWAPYPVGTILQIRDTSGKALADGTTTGEYEVTQTTGSGSQPSITVQANSGVTQAVVVVVKLGQAQDSSTSATTPGGSNTTSTKLTPSGSGTGYGVSTATKSLGFTPQNLAQTALGVALTQSGGAYQLGTEGEGNPPTWDCSGLVYWAYEVCGVVWQRMNAGDQYRFLTNYCQAPVVQLANASIGDLCFFGDMTNAGNQHVGFLHTLGSNGSGQVLFSAMNATDGIGDCDLASFHTELGNGLTAVVGMQGVTVAAMN